jgi:hypothetical protein
MEGSEVYSYLEVGTARALKRTKWLWSPSLCWTDLVKSNKSILIADEVLLRYVAPRVATLTTRFQY